MSDEEARWEPPRQPTPVTMPPPAPPAVQAAELTALLLLALRLVLAGLWLCVGLVPRLAALLWTLPLLAATLALGGWLPQSPVPPSQRPQWLADAAVLALVIPLAVISITVATTARHSPPPSLGIALLPGLGMDVLVAAVLGVLARSTPSPAERLRRAALLLPTVPLLLLGEPAQVSQLATLAGLGTLAAAVFGAVLQMLQRPVVLPLASAGILVVLCLGALVRGSAPWRGMPPVLALLQLLPVALCVLFVLSALGIRLPSGNTRRPR